MNDTPSLAAELSTAVAVAKGQPAALAAVAALYAAIQAEIDARKPVCVISGRCCHFEKYGHRLYVTTIELAAFMAQLPTKPMENWTGQGCPFQAGKLCGVHAIRPMGCRLFFCDPTSTDWQQTLYERFHADLKKLHTRFAVPYFYCEWRAALALLGIRSAVPRAG